MSLLVKACTEFNRAATARYLLLAVKTHLIMPNVKIFGRFLKRLGSTEHFVVKFVEV